MGNWTCFPYIPSREHSTLFSLSPTPSLSLVRCAFCVLCKLCRPAGATELVHRVPAHTTHTLAKTIRQKRRQKTTTYEPASICCRTRSQAAPSPPLTRVVRGCTPVGVSLCPIHSSLHPSLTVPHTNSAWAPLSTRRPYV